jgi:electron transfer flavoprotein beta subunit
MNKIIVGIKRVVDANVRVRVKADGSGVELGNVRMSMNPFDEIALEAALRLKEAGKAAEVVVVSIGPDAAQDMLRTALAMGADRAVLIRVDTAVEPLAVAKVLARLALEEQPELILLGKQSIDSDANQTGQMLAALLDWGQATFASQIEHGDAELIVTREVDGGLETIAVRFPAVVTADLRLNEPRYITLPNIMKAKKKPLDIRPAKDFGIDLTPRLQILRTEEPPARKAGIMVTSVDELIHKLRNDAAVL